MIDICVDVARLKTSAVFRAFLEASDYRKECRRNLEFPRAHFTTEQLFSKLTDIEASVA